MNIKILKQHKSIGPILEFELPMLTVLTGENGSGKTHLFEAISDINKCEIIQNNTRINNIIFKPFNQLIPTVDNQSDPDSIAKIAKGFWEQYTKAKERNKPSLFCIDSLDKPYREIFEYLTKISGVQFLEIKEETIREHIGQLQGISRGNLFVSQLALIFKAYHVQCYDNRVNKIQREDGITNCPEYLDNENFVRKYGLPPWEFINKILKRLKLDYEVSTPEGTKREDQFIFKLLNKKTGIEININDLSTGERTLMSLGLALYNRNMLGGKTELLILDEPDAPLHPSMIKTMLEILEKDIVEELGIPVIISTHSPTTVACSPAKSLYRITKQNKKPERCNLDDSLELLAHEIPNLRVSVENRRQVFVEHKYDVSYYETLFNILSKKYNFVTLPQFLSPHNLGGSNSSDVKNIVKTLCSFGNTQVYGIIDWDLTNKSENNVIILGFGKRYAIENYILEPHLLGLYLIQKSFVTPEDMGLTGLSSYMEVCSNIDCDRLQKITDYVESKMSIKDSIEVESQLINRFSLKVKEALFLMNGHDLEEKYKDIWKPLNSIRGNGDSKLKKDIIISIINDMPGLLSKDIYDTFNAIK